MHARARRRAATHPSEVTVRHEFHGLMSSYWMWMGHGPGVYARAPPKTKRITKTCLSPSLPPSSSFAAYSSWFPAFQNRITATGFGNFG